MTVERAVLGKPLTPNELEVLKWITEGKSVADIAQIMGVCVQTTKNHRAAVQIKLGIYGAALLTRYAIKNGIVEL